MKKQLRSYGIITVGSVIFALSFDWFFAANAVGMGGITGLAQVLNVLFPALSVGIGTILLNVPLFLPDGSSSAFTCWPRPCFP